MFPVQHKQHEERRAAARDARLGKVPEAAAGGGVRERSGREHARR